MTFLYADTMTDAKLKSISTKIIEQIWNEYHRVTYTLFRKYSVSMSKGDSSNEFHYEEKIPPQQTFSRWLGEFCHDNEIQRLSNDELKKEIEDTINKGVANGISLTKTMLPMVKEHLKLKKVFFPSAKELKRWVGSALSEALENRREQIKEDIAQFIKTDVDHLPVVKDFFTKGTLIQFPPVYKGKLNLTKLVKEYQIKEDISKIAKDNGLNMDELIHLSDIHKEKQFIEDKYKAYLNRCAKDHIGVAIIKYLAGRYQDSIDAIIQSFVRNTRLMEFRLKEKYDNLSKVESVSILKENSSNFKALNDAITNAIKTQNISGLNKHREFLNKIEKESYYIRTEEGYYKMVISAHKYSRKLSRRLVGLKFQGLDKHSEVIVECLKEVLKCKSYDYKISKKIVDNLSFLQIPAIKLEDRRIFEPIILLNLANLIHSGRIVVINSRKYRNKWADLVPLNNSPPDSIDLNIVETLKKDLDAVWKRFLDFSDENPDAIDNGKLSTKKLSDKIGPVKPLQHEFSKSLEPVNIIEILKTVNKVTKFIDCFELNNREYTGHTISQSEQEVQALSLIIAKSMNIGLSGVVKMTGKDITLGKLKNFYDNYVSPNNLENALRRILNSWDKLKLGCNWGDGASCSSDGKVISSFTANLISRFHYRKRKIGVTVYWFVRNDWIANYVQVIGNDEWESWYILDGILNSFCDKEINKSCGDTQGQLLALWGLSKFLGKEIRVRFRSIKNIMLYKPDKNFNTGKLENVDVIDWDLITKGLIPISRVVETIKKKKISSRDILSTNNIFDENGFNVMDAIREVGKVTRTIFILNYMMCPDIRQEIREGCNKAEFWNKFQDFIFWGKGRVIASNNPQHQQEIILFLMLVMNAIVFYNAYKYGDEIEKYSELGELTSIFWEHINLFGTYDI